MFGNIAIIAPGLLGASLGLAAKELSLARCISVWARRPETRLACRESSWCDAAPLELSDAVREADLIVIATPVGTIAEMVGRIAPHLKPGCLVTDVGSTKSLICRRSTPLLPAENPFVGAHPMAGSEKSGMEHADARLFAERPCFVTPLEATPPQATETIVAFWRALGMQVTTCSPETHDEIVAHLSHLPHILATVLCETLAGQKAQWKPFAGNGLRDTSRIASGHPGMWTDILQQNREEILRAVEAFENQLQHFRSALNNEQWASIRHSLERGKAYRDTL